MNNAHTCKLLPVTYPATKVLQHMIVDLTLSTWGLQVNRVEVAVVLQGRQPWHWPIKYIELP